MTWRVWGGESGEQRRRSRETRLRWRKRRLTKARNRTPTCAARTSASQSLLAIPALLGNSPASGVSATAQSISPPLNLINAHLRPQPPRFKTHPQQTRNHNRRSNPRRQLHARIRLDKPRPKRTRRVSIDIVIPLLKERPDVNLRLP